MSPFVMLLAKFPFPYSSESKLNTMEGLGYGGIRCLPQVFESCSTLTVD